MADRHARKNLESQGFRLAITLPHRHNQGDTRQQRIHCEAVSCLLIAYRLNLILTLVKTGAPRGL